MKDLDTITVYWSSPNYDPNQESWSMLYRTPVSLISSLKEIKSDISGGMFSCPAIKDLCKNVFVFKANINDKHSLPIQYLLDVQNVQPVNGNERVPTDGLVSFGRSRLSALSGYSNIVYNLAWMLFADEPVNARFTAPYLPPTVPAQGAILSQGRFDIGQWYRGFNLDYHIPLSTQLFEIKENDHLFYLHLETNKKVKFQQYFMSDKLKSLSLETINTPNNYGRLKSLKDRYLIGNRSGYPKHILSEIKKNLIED